MKHILTGFIITVFLAGPAFAAETIDGWGDLKFGMNIDEARAAEPRLNSKEKTNPMGEGITIISGPAALDIAGRNYRLETSFRSQDRKLQTITLVWESAPSAYVDEKQCDAIYQEHLRMMVNKYGAFDDLKKHNPLAQDEGVNMSASEIRQTADGSAVYFKKAFTQMSEYALEARKTGADSGMITVSASVGSVFSLDGYKTGAGICGVNIAFYKKLPAYVPPLPDDSHSKDKF